MIETQPFIVQSSTIVLEALNVMRQEQELGLKSRQSNHLAFQQRRSLTHTLLVQKAHELVGILTEFDVVRCIASGFELSTTPIVEVMTSPVITIEETELVNPFFCIHLMSQHSISHLPVINHQKKVVGLLTAKHIYQLLPLKALLQMHSVINVMSREVVTAGHDTPIQDLAVLMVRQRVKCVVIVQNKELNVSTSQTPIGLITAWDIVQTHTHQTEVQNLCANSLISSPLVCMSSQDNLWEAKQKMDQYKSHRFVVIDDQNKLLGVVTPTDLLKAVDLIEMQQAISRCREEVEDLKDEQTDWVGQRTLQIEVAKIEPEEKFRAIFNDSCQFIAFLTPEGTVLEVNQTALDIGGLSREDVINHPFWETDWWKHSNAVQEQLKTSIQRAAQGLFLRYEIELQSNHGQRIIFDFSIRPILDESNQVKWLLPEGRDISKLKTIQDALQQSQTKFSKLTEASPVGIFQTDAEGHCIYVNDQWCQIAGISAEEALGDGWVMGLHSEDKPRVFEAWKQITQEHDVFRLEYRFQSPHGKVTWVYGQAVPETNALGLVKGYIGTITNITERKHSELALAQHKSKLESLVEARTAELQSSQKRHAYMYQKTPVMLHSIDHEGYIHHVSDYWLEKLGYTREEVIGHKTTEFLTPESREYAENLILPNYYKAGYCFDIPYQIVSKEGQVIDVLLSATRHLDETGQAMSLAVMVDVTASNQELFREKELAQVTLHSIADAVITTNAQGSIEYINPVAEELTGWQAEDARGKELSHVFDIIHEKTRSPAENPVDKVLREGTVATLADHTALISKQGIEYSIEDSAAPIRNREGQIIGAVVVFHDATQARKLQRELSWQASHDKLTGLVNRQKFEQELAITLQELTTAPQNHVLCYLDLDRFKIVNDTCGHLAGDELLRQISQRLKDQVRAGDIVARLGGDEFGILLKQCALVDARIISEKILKAVQSFRFLWEAKAFSVGVSIGLVSVDESSTLTEILSAADAACYVAKDQGRNRVQVYEHHNMVLKNQRGERQWSVQIQHALEDNRFCLYRQIIVGSKPPNRPMYEILLRMIDEQGNLILPDRFIPAAERYNLMQSIDRWVISTFFDHLSRTLTGDSSTDGDERTTPLYFINLSGNSIDDVQFLNFVKTQIRTHDIPPHSIGFEITETAAISNLQQARHLMAELHHLGCEFSLDDFGSGMSSFGYLKNLPVDYLKIDGHFVRDLSDDPATYAIVEAINHVGHVIGVKTIAEYVENDTLRQTLNSIGVDYLQGYGIAEPVPLQMNV